MLSVRTINYAAPPAGHIWQWSHDYEAIEWVDGSTLALWQEVHAILSFAGKDRGIPPLGSLLLLLGACREDWPAHRASNHARVRQMLGLAPNDAIPTEMAEIFITALDTVHRLPKDLRSSLAAKCHLASAVFSGGPHSLPRKESETVARELSLPSRNQLADRKPEFDAKARFVRDLRALRIGLERHDAETLESLLRTGIERTVLQPAPVADEVVEDTDPRLLLDTLIAAGGESGAAAMVAKRAIAMMNFPGHVGTPRDLPVGGIADITNRGTIDRLLPGELAWDDLVLAARLVHNEALYFRREIPPLNVAVAHTLLLGRELRLWGVGRIFSLGVALGLWHHPSLNAPGETFECVAATLEDFEYLELNRPDQVRAALETLIPASDPQHFLMKWWDAARIVDDPAVPDVSLITDAVHLGDSVTRTLLGEIAAWIASRGGHFRIIALDRRGNLEVQAWMGNGHRTLFRGAVDLDEILQERTGVETSRPAPPPLIQKPRSTHPVSPIYDLDRLPFFFPVVPLPAAFHEDASSGSQGGGIGISADKRLMEWPKAGWGAQDLCAAPPGTSHWVGRDNDRQPVIIAAAEKVGGSVRVYRFEEGGLKEIPVVASRHAFPRKASVSGGVVILSYHERAEAISLASGHRLDEVTFEDPSSVGPIWFDGDKISYGPPATGSSRPDYWKGLDASWSRMIVPDGVSLKDGVLRIRSGKEWFEFDPMRPEWKPAPSNTFDPRALNKDTLPNGESFWIAILGGRLRVSYDRRGVLHLEDKENPGNPYSLLLSTPASAVWHPHWDLFALDNRLVPVGSTPAGDFPRYTLRDFLSVKEFQSLGR